ncbi:MAG: ester cyclase [Candidatus Binatia bacterium]
MPTSSEENKAVIRRFWNAMNTRQWDTFDELLAPDVVRHCQATPEFNVRSCEQFREFCRWEAAVFPDSRQTITHLVAEGDFVAVWATYAGTQRGQMGPFPPTGKNFQIDFGAVFRMVKGKIAEWWVTWDNMALLTQLGHLPPSPSKNG